MNVLAIGTDLVEVARIRRLLELHQDRFVKRIFTSEESAYCRACADPAIHYAARFAAKEAVAKALNTGLAEGVIWTDIEVSRSSTTGVPSVRLHGHAAGHAEALGISRVLISLTHTKEHALAFVQAMGEAKKALE